MRLFVAAEIPGSVLEALSSLQARLRNEVRGARWAPSSAMHLTFKFIGEMPEADVPGLRAALRRALPAAGVAPFSLCVRGLGVFPDRRRPRVLWAGLAAAPAGMPQQVQQVIDAAAHEAGCPREERPFRPHLTLARFGERGGGDDLAPLVSASASVEWGTFDVASVWLFQSILHPGGAEHRRLEEYGLA